MPAPRAHGRKRSNFGLKTPRALARAPAGKLQGRQAAALHCVRRVMLVGMLSVQHPNAHLRAPPAARRKQHAALHMLGGAPVCTQLLLRAGRDSPEGRRQARARRLAAHTSASLCQKTGTLPPPQEPQGLGGQQ